MRRIGDIIPATVLGAIVGVALLVTVNGWSYLVDAGGWYALHGQFLAVAATLVILLIACALALALLALPFLLVFALTDPELTPGAAARRPVDALRARGSALARAAFAVANLAWKAAWWGWWFVSGVLRPMDRDHGR